MTYTLPDEVVEELGHGMIRKWWFDRQVVAYIATEESNEAVDVWAKHTLADSNAWNIKKPYLALHDHTILKMTTYNRKVAEDVARKTSRKLHGRFANVIKRGIMGQAIWMFGTTRLKMLLPTLESQFFFDYEPAVKWLKMGIK
jgi:hypothetical protein